MADVSLVVFPASTSYRDITEGTSFSPIATTSLAEVTRLSEVIIIVVAKLGV